MVLRTASAERAGAVADAASMPPNDAETVLAKSPFLLTRCSSDLRYVFVSEAYARMLGHRPEELVIPRLLHDRLSTQANLWIGSEHHAPPAGPGARTHR